MEEPLYPPDDLDEPLPLERQALLDRFKAYAVWHPRLVQVQTQVLETIWEPADVAFVVVLRVLRMARCSTARNLSTSIPYTSVQ